MDLDPIRLRVLKLLDARGSNLKTASNAIGKNAAYLHQFIYRGTPKVLPEHLRDALAKHLQVDSEQLKHRHVPQRKTPSKTHEAEYGAAPMHRVPRGFSVVPEIDVRASAGPGAVHEGLEETKATWLFPEPLIRHELRARPDDLRMITVDGDSMEPLLSSGDRILVDTNQRIPVPPGIFVIWDGMGLVAKRIEHVPASDPPKISVRSLNPEYPSYELTGEEVNIVGRVVWAGKRL
jgi:phage repressor protein C with HTH and peptisase S24 domain